MEIFEKTSHKAKMQKPVQPEIGWNEKWKYTKTVCTLWKYNQLVS